MANNFRLANAAASACAGDGASAGLSAFIGSGAKICIYAGAQNTTPETAPAGTLLGTHTVTGTFGTATNGVITTSTIGDATVAATGTAACFMLFKSDGITPIADGTVGTSDCDINYDSVSWVETGTASLTSLAITVPPH
jgi:hypothetical protein